MSESALEFVETWVEDKIEEMEAAPANLDAEAAKLATECVTEAQEEGVTQSEIDDVFDDLAAFIAGEIQEAFGRKTRHHEGMEPVDEDDARVIDDEEDEEEEDDGEDDDEDEKDKKPS